SEPRRTGPTVTQDSLGCPRVREVQRNRVGHRGAVAVRAARPHRAGPRHSVDGTRRARTEMDAVGSPPDVDRLARWADPSFAGFLWKARQRVRPATVILDGRARVDEASRRV